MSLPIQQCKLVRSGATLSYIDILPLDPKSLADPLPPILFIHGYLDSCLSWSRIIPHIVKSCGTTHRILSMTLRGWGDSDKSGVFSVDAYAEDVVEFLDTLGIESAVLCGHSMGTLISTAVAARHPTRVAGIALCGAASKLSPSHQVAEGLTLGDIGKTTSAFEDDKPLSADGLEFLTSFQMDDLKPFISEGKVDAAFGDQVMKETLKAIPRSYRDAWRSMEEEDHTAELKLVRCKVLIISGTNDVVFDRAEQARLLGLLTGTPFISFRTVGPSSPHGAIWTHAEECAEHITAFLKSV